MIKLKTHVLSFLTAFALAVGLLSGLATTAYAVEVNYQEASYNSSTGEVTYTTKTVDATPITSSTSMSQGWYVVNSDVTLDNRTAILR